MPTNADPGDGTLVPKPIYLWIAQGLFALQTLGLTIVAALIFPTTVALGVLAFGGAALYVVVIVGIQQRRPWARIATLLALALVWLTLGVRYVLTDSPSIAMPALSGLVMLLAVPLLFDASVRSYFQQPPVA